MKYPECITVGQLIEELSKLPKDMLVGRHGHFGEFHEMTKSDFYVSRSYRVSNGAYWRTADKSDTVEHLQVSPPDIGEEPD